MTRCGSTRDSTWSPPTASERTSSSARDDQGALALPPPALVEEFGVAAVVVAAQDGTVAGLDETVLLEHALHAVVVGQGRAADRHEAQSVEDVVEEQGHGLGGVPPAAEVTRTYLYAYLAAVPAEVVEGRHTDRFLRGLDDKSLHARILPAGQVVTAGRGEGDGDG